MDNPNKVWFLRCHRIYYCDYHYPAQSREPTNSFPHFIEITMKVVVHFFPLVFLTPNIEICCKNEKCFFRVEN